MRILLLLSLLSVVAPDARADSDKRLIVVSAVAQKAIEPDLIEMNVEVWSKSNTGDKAQALAAMELKKVQAVFDQYKLRKEDIRTEAYSFGPEYVWDQGSQQNKLAGFRSTQTLRVILRKISEAGKFIDDLSTVTKAAGKPMSGVNVNNIQWDSSKKVEAEVSTLADAVKVTRRRAEELAKAAGVKIKSVHRLAHQASPEIIRPMAGNAKNFRGEMMMAAADAGAGTSLSEGQIKISVSVDA